MTKRKAQPADTNDPRALEAAEWLLRLSEEPVPSEDIEAWRQWLAASSLNHAAFARMQTIWELASRVVDPHWPTDREVAADVDDVSTGALRGARVDAVAGATASMPPKRRAFAFAAVIAMMAVGAGIFWKPFLNRNESVFATGIAEQRSFLLSDGSRVTLGGASRVRVAFTPERRRIDLEAGEAFFSVRKDSHRPFDVRAGSASVVAVGTAFSVRRAGDRVQVAVTSGVVSVSPKADELTDEARKLRLNAGMQTVVHAGAVSIPAAAEVAVVLAKQEGRFQYNEEPLRYVVADLNRYSTIPIEIEGSNAGSLLVTGTVLERDLPGWLQGLEQALPVAVAFEDERITIRHNDSLTP